MEDLRLKADANAGAYTRAFDFADSLAPISGFEELILLEKALLQLDTAVGGKNKLTRDATLYTTINTYATDESKAGTWQAKAALRAVYGSEMGLHYLTPPNNSGSRAMGSEPSSNPKNQGEVPVSAPLLKQESGGRSGGTYHQELSVYPNPASISLNLLFSSRSTQSVRYVIVDLLGSRVAEGSLPPNVNLEIGTGDLKSGVYFVTLIQNNVVVQTQKLSVNK